MGTGNADWKGKGGGNPAGRPKGARNKRTQEILDRIAARGDPDPLDVMSEILATDPNPEHKMQAANVLAPYIHSKMASIPTPRFIEQPLELPTPTTVQEATDSIALLTTKLAAGEIDFDSATLLINGLKEFITARLGGDLEQRIALLEAAQPPQRLGVSLGLGLQISQTESTPPATPPPNGPSTVIDHHPAPIDEPRLPGPGEPWRQE